MNLRTYLLESRTKEELASELARVVKENVILKDKAFALEVENFWLKAKENIYDFATTNNTRRS